MVLRRASKSRKLLGTRSWGAGNIKNRRGSGGRGGVGNAGRKSKFTRMVKYEKERVRSEGFTKWTTFKTKETTLESIMRSIRQSKEPKPTVELPGFKVLSNGRIDRAVIVKASGFSKKAAEKIKGAGGEAVKL